MVSGMAGMFPPRPPSVVFGGPTGLSTTIFSGTGSLHQAEIDRVGERGHRGDELPA